MRIRSSPSVPTRDWLDSSARHPGPDLSRLASHLFTGWGRQAHNWVAESWRAQIAGSGVRQPPMGDDPEPPRRERQPAPVKPPEGRLTDDFLKTVADNYVWALRMRRRPAPTIARQTGYSVRTVHSWIRKARDRGILGPASQGRVS